MKTIIIDGIEYNLTPKVLFKKGDWITNGDYTWKILEVKPLDYILQSQDGNIVDDTISHVDEQFHSFTIQDAKDGDVLSYKDEIFIVKSSSNLNIVYYCCYDNYHFITESIYSLTIGDLIDVKPATKEERYLLFQKMEEAGYEWDAEKKELKKVEQQPTEWHREDEQNLNACLGYIPDEYLRRWLMDAIHAKYDRPWSEEDENLLKLSLENLTELKDRFGEEYGKVGDCIVWLQSLKDRVQPQTKQEWDKEDEKCIRLTTDIIDSALRAGFCVQIDRDRCIDWLKSLRPQSHWKPNDEQMKALYEETQKSDRIRDERIVSLFEDLNKLK